MKPLVIAAHGTRVPQGRAECRRLIERVGRLLPGVAVTGAYVELDSPTIGEAVGAALDAADERSAVVVPLMLGRGGHVLDDIPDGIAAGRSGAGGDVAYAEHLGPDPRLRTVLLRRIDAALGDWERAATTVVLLGRGCSVAEANADHVRLARLIFEEGGFADVAPAFIQVTRPGLVEALDRAYAAGARRIAVAPNFLFPGRLERWARRDVASWVATHPGAEARVADVIGDCEELARVVVDRYRAAASVGSPGSPVYLSGLDLRGRPVLVAGAGRVASRRIPRLLDAGATIRVVAPEASDLIRGLADAGRLAWLQRAVEASDLDGAWYALACTSDADANALVVGAAEERHTFCVRADRGQAGSARTPAVGTADGLTVGVIGDRDPRRSRRARDAAIEAVAQQT